MIIAHIPVGLALARILTKSNLTKPIIAIAAFGAIFPDLDLIRFYLFDNHQRHHHDYWTHIPMVWLLIIVLWFSVTKSIGRAFGRWPLTFFAAVFSHLCLDTVAGAIKWLWPFSFEGFSLVTVPATHSKWYLSFLTHWTFAAEIIVSILSLCVAFIPYGHHSTKDTGKVASQTEAGGGR